MTGYTVTADGLTAQHRGRRRRAGRPGRVRRVRAATPAPRRGVLLRHHGLHVELVIDRAGPIGATDPAGIQDVLAEAAVTTIVDFEDSVAAVDAADKVAAYRNWLGLNTGELSAPVEKGGRPSPAGSSPTAPTPTRRARPFTLPGRSLLLVRNVGHLMTTDAVLDAEGAEVFEGILDAIVTALARAARAAGRRAPAQQPDRLGLHRQAQAARARRGGLHRHAVRPGGGAARARAEHAQDRPDGRGAAHLGQPRRRRARGQGPDRVHQHRLPRPHRRRDPHLDGGRADGAQGRHEDAAVDPRLRGQQRRHRARARPGRPRPDRQGHVDDARPDGGHAGAEDRPPAGGRHHRLGALAHRRRPCTRCTTTRSTSPAAGRARHQDTGAARRHAPASRSPTRPAGPPTTGRPRSTSTSSRSSATWSAGSTRASAAPRSPTSTTSR